MSRPKGSKNKKTILSEAQLGNKIAAEEVTLAKLKDDEAKLNATITELKEQLKMKRKQLRTSERTLAVLRQKQEQADADAVARVQQMEVEKVLNTLVRKGKSADEILELLNEKS